MPIGMSACVWRGRCGPAGGNKPMKFQRRDPHPKQSVPARRLLYVVLLLAALMASALAAGQAHAAKKPKPVGVEFARDTAFGLATTRVHYKSPSALPLPRKVGVGLTNAREIPHGTALIADATRVKPTKGKKSRKLELMILTAVFQRPGGTGARGDAAHSTLRAAADELVVKYKVKAGGWTKNGPKLDSDELEFDAAAWESFQFEGAGVDELCDQKEFRSPALLFGEREPHIGLNLTNLPGLDPASPGSPSPDLLGSAFDIVCELNGIDTAPDFFLALDALIGGAPPAQPPPRDFFGVVTNTSMYGEYLVNPAFVLQQFNLIGQAGAGSARVLLGWDASEQKDDDWTWNNSDTMIGGLAAEGVATSPYFYQTSQFISADPLVPPVDSELAKAEWQEFVREAVARYMPGGVFWTDVYPLQHPGKPPVPVTKWQIWNEQNASKYIHPGPDVPKYAELLRISDEAIHSVDPNALVFVGAMTSAPSAVEPATYLEQLYQHLGVSSESGRSRKAGVPFDGICVNPYGSDLTAVALELAKVLEVIRLYDPLTYILICEFGWSSRKTAQPGWSADPAGESKLDKTPEEQAELLKAAFQFFQRKRDAWNILAAFWYTWRDDPASLNICRWCSAAGLVDPNLNPKPAYSAYQQAATGG